MMTAAAYGTLITVKPVKTKTGKPMTVGTLAVKLPIAKTEEQETQWLNLMAFGDTAEALAKLEPRTNISAFGRLQFSRYEKDGEEKTVLQMIADNIISARTARPKAGRKKSNLQPAAFEALDRFQEDDPFKDEIPF